MPDGLILCVYDQIPLAAQVNGCPVVLNPDSLGIRSRPELEIEFQLSRGGNEHKIYSRIKITIADALELRSGTPVVGRAGVVKDRVR